MQVRLIWSIRWERILLGSTLPSSKADSRVAPDEMKSIQRDREDYEKEEEVCSGRDLNPGSATRKAAMLDRTVQPY
jgi:hypothetical protein